MTAAAPPPVVTASCVGRAFDIFATDRARARHALWSLAGRVPGLAAMAARARAGLARRTWALRGVSFEVRRGEAIGIIGANGSGKSTLLHLLCGTLAASEGSVRTDGRVGALLELGTGFSPDLTGRENVRLSGLLHGLDEHAVAARAEAIAAFADIGPYLDQPVRTYSSGMYVRLAFAVMAHIDADVLVVDEALAVGDIRFVQKCLAHLDRFRAGGGTLIFVSHDLPAVQRLCSRVLWLDGGRLRMDGPPREVTEAYFDSMIGTSRPGSVGPAGPAGPSTATLGERALPAPSATLGERALPTPSATLGERALPTPSARITDVRLVDANGLPVTTVRGGEHVWLLVDAASDGTIAQPIIGFYVKDRLGQQLFGENTLAAPHCPAVAPGTRFGARFGFVMPRLFPGDYLVAVAVAEGSQASHVHHEWRHEAWHFSSGWPGGATGLVGIEIDVCWIADASSRREAPAT